MPRGQCSVCALPSDVRSYGEEMLATGKKQYREIVAMSPGGASKSSWHRHMQNCFRRARFYNVGKPKGSFERLIVVWPNGEMALGSDSFTGKFRDGDVLLRVTYEEVAIRKLGNPAALITEALIDEANAEHRERFPESRFFWEKESDAAPCEVGDRETIVDNIHNCSEPAPGANLPTECEHVMVRVSGDISRCVNCGHQEQPPVIVGVTRAWHEKQKRSIFAKIPKFGRFG
jgi:hypothetical protein